MRRVQRTDASQPKQVETLMPGALADVRAANAAGGNYAAQLVYVARNPSACSSGLRI